MLDSLFNKVAGLQVKTRNFLKESYFVFFQTFDQASLPNPQIINLYWCRTRLIYLFCPYEKLVQLFFHSTSQFLENVIKTSMRSSPKTYPGLLQSKLERFVTIVNGIEQSALHKKWSFPSRNFFSKCDQIRMILRI